MRKIVFCVLISLLLCTCSVQALNFDQMYVRVEENGDADVILTYQLSVWEYFGMLSQWVKPDQYLEGWLSNSLHRNVTVLCMGKEGAMLRVMQFALVSGDTYRIDGFRMPEQTQYGPFSTVDLSADIVIVFPDGRSQTYPDSMTVPSLTHTFAQGESVAPEPPIQTCWKRDLPLSWLFPDEYAPLVAIFSGIAIVAVSNVVGTQGASIFQKIWMFMQKFVLKVLAPLMSRKEVEVRKLRPSEGRSALLLTLSKREFLVIAASALIFSLAFLLKDRLQIQGVTILVFILMGGMATVAHELSHRFFAHRWQSDSEFQFWGLGTVMMLVTAWLFGNVFSKPSRTLTSSTDHLTSEQGVLVAIAGPLANIVFALASLLLLPLGGVLTLIGQAGFSMNLLSCVYDLVPVVPMDGKRLFAYNKIIWAALFFPLLFLYIAIFML
jgi:Zn-dependent protease